MQNRFPIFYLVIIILLFVNYPILRSQQLVINEVMASNATTIADEDGDYEDWIEIYNYGDEPINLKGFGLSDDYDNPFRWVFPDVSIEPGGFLLVWASGKDRINPKEQLHTNFSISSTGEELLLSHFEGEIIDEIPPTNIPTDISYGRNPDRLEELFYFNNPTPGLPNTTTFYRGILEKVDFSYPPGFYSDTVFLELSHPDPHAVIFYTLDGSIPDTNSIKYTSPIIITDRSDEENQHSMIPTNYISGYRGWIAPSNKVAKMTPVRAKAFASGFISNKNNSGSYFVFPEKNQRYSLDVISIITDPNNLFSDSIGIYVPGVNYSEGNDGSGNYTQRGDEWERTGSFELFGDSLLLKQFIGLRIHGGFSRRFPQKSFRLYARNEYGESRFNYNIFTDSPYESYNRLLLRNSGNDWNFTMFRDAAAQSLVGHFNLDIQAYRPTVVFINGEYWGIKNIRERYDKHYLERVYSVDPDNIDLLTGRRSVIEGDNAHYNNLINYLITNDMADDNHYSVVNRKMDIDNFIDYYSAQIFYANNDWPHSNIDFWRLKVPHDPNAPKGHDGRWRWLLYDVDRSLGYSTNFRFNMLEWLTTELNPRNNAEWPNLLLRNLLDNESFKYEFINRISGHLNTAFKPSRVHNILDSLKAIIKPEIGEHIERWGHPLTINVWNTNVQVMYTNATRRPEFVRQHIREHFNIEKDIEVRLNVDDQEKGFIRINTIDVNPSTPGVPEDTYPWTGIYFHGIPVEIEAKPHFGYAFSHWVGDDTSKDPVITITPEDDISLKAYFKKVDTPEPVTAWFFGDDLDNDTPLENIPASFSVNSNSMFVFNSPLDGYPFEEGHPYWRTASLERRNAPTEINYRPEINNDIPFEDSGMRGVQVRQPLAVDENESELIFHISTIGYHDITFRFAAMDEGAAEKLIIDYSVNNGEPEWTSSDLENDTLDLWEIYQLFEVDMTNISEVENNPDFLVRIRFSGSDMTASDDNRVTLNNISLTGIPVNYYFYSKPSGDLAELTTWGTEPDGSGEAPESFELHTARFHIVNRESATLSGDWRVDGIDSRVIVGNGINEITLRVASRLEAVVNIMEEATVELASSHIPHLNILENGSNVIFSGNAVNIPYVSFSNLVIDDIDPSFKSIDEGNGGGDASGNDNTDSSESRDGSGDIEIRGNLELRGTVGMPDARGSDEYSLMFTGNNNQLISGNGNVLRGYNVTFEKQSGSVAFSTANGGTVLSSDNQLILNISGDAMFKDNGIDIYAGNSVNIDGSPANYDFTGTLILAGTEEGIVKGAGNNNNFNVRDSGSNNSLPRAALNNIIVRAENPDGEFRFRDGGPNQLVIKGDLIVEQGAAGRIRFYENDVYVGGDLVLEDGFSGSIDDLWGLVFSGAAYQVLAVPDIIHINNLTVDNPENLTMEGIVRIAGTLDFVNGYIDVKEGGLMSVAPGGAITGYDSQRYVEGPLGISMNKINNEQVFFPLGRDGEYRLMGLETEHANDNEVMYVAELFNSAPPQYSLSGGLLSISDLFYIDLDVLGDFLITSGYASISYYPGEYDEENDLPGIAMVEGNRWVNLGGIIINGSIRSTSSFSSPGILTIAEQAEELTMTATAGNGGQISPEGTHSVFTGSDVNYLIESDNGYHIESLLVDGEPVEEAEGSFVYNYRLENVISNHTIKVSFSRNDYSDVLIYPNPATDHLYVEFNQNMEHVALITLVNAEGRTVLERTLESGDNRTGILNLAGLPQGSYIIRISYAGYEILKKAIIFPN